MAKKISALTAIILLWCVTAQAAEPGYLQALNVAALRQLPAKPGKIRVAVIGSGLNANDPELAGKINRELSRSFIDSTPLIGEDPHESYVGKIIIQICGDQCELVSLKTWKILPGPGGVPGVYTTQEFIVRAFQEVAGWTGQTVVNASLYSGASADLQEALQALERKAFVSLIAGNFNKNPVDYPGFYGYEMPHVLCVASAELTGLKSWYSNWGPRAEIAGFGTLPTIGWGTSLAAPQAAGIAALLLQRLEARLSPAMVKKLIKVGAKVNPNLTAWFGDQWSGRGLQLDAGGALEAYRRLKDMRLIGYKPALILPGDTVTLRVSEDLTWLSKFALTARLRSESGTITAAPVMLADGLQFLAPNLPGEYSVALMVEGSLATETMPVIVSPPPSRPAPPSDPGSQRQNGSPRESAVGRGR